MRKILILLNFIFIFNAYAITVSDLYNAEVPVDGYKSANNQEVLKKGMLEVLIKITGNGLVDEHPNIQAALENPQQYLLKYKQEVREITQSINDSEDSVTTKQLVSIQNYSKTRIDKLLNSSDIIIWGQQRPLSLAWIMIEFGPQNRIILNESDVSHFNSQYKDIISKQAKKRGIPLAYPIQDLEEQVSISPSVIWSQFPDDLKKASERYAPDIILAGSLQAKDEYSWVGKWLVIIDGVATEYTTSSSQLQTAMQVGVDWLADNLAKVYTTHLTAPSEVVKIKINGVDKISVYTAIDKYLKNLSVIESYKLDGLGSNWLEYDIKIKSGKNTLLSALNFDSKLVEMKPNKVNKPGNTNIIVEYDVDKISQLPEENKDKDTLQFRWRS